MKRHEISIAFIVVALIVLAVAALSGCQSGHVHHDMPTNHGVQNGCHWVTTTSKHRHHVKVNGRWKYVTVKSTSKSLVCHH